MKNQLTKAGPKDVRPDSELSWHAVYTRYKCEKQVVRSLKSRGISAYVPLREKVRKYGARRRVSHIPLIHCYVFVQIEPHERRKVLQAPNVQGFTGNSRRPVPIPEKEIDWLKRITGEKNELEITEETYSKGAEVEIVSGPLSGIRGRLTGTNGKKQFLVELTTIGYKLRMAIDKGILNVTKPASASA